MIDTGAIGLISGSLQSSVASRLRKMGSLANVGEGQVIDGVGERASRPGVLSSFSLGGHDLINTFWLEHQNGDMPTLATLYFITQFNIIFDFPNSMMYLTKNKNFGHPDVMDLSGLDLRRVDGQVLVKSVYDGTVAEKSGIRAGDIVKSVGDLDASNSRLFVLKKALCQPGARVPVVIERGTETLERELVLPSPAIARRTEPVGVAR